MQETFDCFALYLGLAAFASIFFFIEWFLYRFSFMMISIFSFVLYFIIIFVIFLTFTWCFWLYNNKWMSSRSIFVALNWLVLLPLLDLKAENYYETHEGVVVDCDFPFWLLRIIFSDCSSDINFDLKILIWFINNVYFNIYL